MVQSIKLSVFTENPLTMCSACASPRWLSSNPASHPQHCWHWRQGHSLWTGLSCALQASYSAASLTSAHQTPLAHATSHASFYNQRCLQTLPDAPWGHNLSSLYSFSRVKLFVTPWTAACQASLSITNSWSLIKLMSILSVMPSNHLILCHPLLLLPSIFPSTGVFSLS